MVCVNTTLHHIYEQDPTDLTWSIMRSPTSGDDVDFGTLQSAKFPDSHCDGVPLDPEYPVDIGERIRCRDWFGEENCTSVTNTGHAVMCNKVCAYGCVWYACASVHAYMALSPHFILYNHTNTPTPTPTLTPRGLMEELIRTMRKASRSLT